MAYRDAFDAIVTSTREWFDLSSNQLPRFSLFRWKKRNWLDDVYAAVFWAQTGMAVTLAHGMLSGSIADVGSQIANVTLVTSAAGIVLNRVVAWYRKAMSENLA